MSGRKYKNSATEDVYTDRQLDLSYLKQSKSNPSLSLSVESPKYHKWKPIQISASPILLKLLLIK